MANHCDRDCRIVDYIRAFGRESPIHTRYVTEFLEKLGFSLFKEGKGSAVTTLSDTVFRATKWHFCFSLQKPRHSENWSCLYITLPWHRVGFFWVFSGAFVPKCVVRPAFAVQLEMAKRTFLDSALRSPISNNYSDNKNTFLPSWGVNYKYMLREIYRGAVCAEYGHLIRQSLSQPLTINISARDLHLGHNHVRVSEREQPKTLLESGVTRPPQKAEKLINILFWISCVHFEMLQP